MKRALYYAASPLAALLLWELCAQQAWIDIRFFPSPSAIGKYALSTLDATELWMHLSASLQRIGWGYGAGVIFGIGIGITMGLSRVARIVGYPLVAMFYPIPKIALFPLVMLIFGIGEISKIFVVALGCFFLVVMNTLRGVDQLDRIHFDVAAIFQLRRSDLIRHVILPGALPSIFTGLRLALGYSLVIVVAAEFSGASTGIGYWIWQAWETFSIKRLYVGIFVIAGLGIICSACLDIFERLLTPWRDTRRHIIG